MNDNEQRQSPYGCFFPVSKHMKAMILSPLISRQAKERRAFLNDKRRTESESPSGVQ